MADRVILTIGTKKGVFVADAAKLRRSFALSEAQIWTGIGGRLALAAATPEPAAGPRHGHGTGHGLGLEVHEEPRIGRPLAGQPDLVLQPGMVFTIEPGVYVAGIGGVRIEDDVLVTDEGCLVLTANGG